MNILKYIEEEQQLLEAQNEKERKKILLRRYQREQREHFIDDIPLMLLFAGLVLCILILLAE